VYVYEREDCKESEMCRREECVWEVSGEGSAEEDLDAEEERDGEGGEEEREDDVLCREFNQFQIIEII
jgi:hypothetical protein